MDGKKNSGYEKLKRQLSLIKETVTGETYNLGSKFFIEVVQKLNETLNADYTFIGNLNEKADEIETIALCSAGKILDNFSYKLENTPCKNVVGQSVCSYKEHVTDLFPKDQLLIDMGIEAYIGVPLFNSTKKPTGILVSLFKNPIDDVETLESVLLIFASRAGAELQHKENTKKLCDIQLDLKLKNDEFQSLNEEYLTLNEELQENNEKLSLSEERFRMLFENSGTANTFFNLNGILEYQNTASASFLRGKPTDFIGKNIIELFGKQQGKMIIERFEEVKQNKKTQIFETNFKLPSGNKWFRTIYQPVINSINQLAGVQLISREITQEKEAEIALNESRKKYSNVVETATDLITIVDKTGKFIFVNHASENVFGLKPKDCIGLSAFDFIHPDDKASTEAEFENWLSSVESNFAIENRQVHKNGSISHMLWSIYINRDTRGGIIDITSIARDITERKKIEKELLAAKNIAEHNELRLKIAQEASKAGAWEWNIVENTFYWPNELLKIFGFSPDSEFGFDTWRKAVHPDDVALADKRVEIAIQNKEDLVSDYRIIKPDNSIRWIRAFGRTFYEGDKPVRMVGMCLDITEQKLNEAARKENEEKFMTTVQNIPGMIYRASSDLTVDLILNSKIVCGYEPEDFLAKKITWQELILNDDKERILKDGEQLTREKCSIIQEYRIKANDGSVRYVKDYKTSRFEGADFTGVDGIVFDNTQSKLLEEELKIARDNAQASEALLQKTQQIALMGNFKHNLPENKTYWSENTKELFGLNDDDFRNKIDVIIPKLIHPDDRKMFWEKSLGLIQHGGESHMYYRIITPANETKYISSYAQLILDKNGEPKEIIGSVQDVTEIKKIENALLIAKHKAEESDRLKTAFLANMSHEIRTPMNGILGFTELLAGSNLSEEKRGYYANIIKSSSQQLLNIISDIIDISKIEAEEFILSDTTFKVDDFVNDTLEQAGMLLKQKNKLHIKLTYSNNSNVTFLTADKNRLAQVLLNLLSNAIKFTESGSIQVIIESVNSDYLKFMVSDSGIGIDKGNQKIIFERFRQLDDNSFEGGTGLGLSICKALVEKMGGEINVNSEPNKGSTFYFTIQTKNVVQSSAEPVERISELPLSKKTKILIAEDEEINYLYLYEILNNDKYELIHAINGKIAVELFSETHPDIVLMDIKMPEMNGFQALEKIKKLNPNIPVIAITAYAMSSDEKKALDAGFLSYLPKPVSKEKLIATVNQYAQ